MSRHEDTTPQNRRCVWGNYVMGLFVTISVFVLIIEYTDRSAIYRDAPVSSLPSDESSSPSSHSTLHSDATSAEAERTKTFLGRIYERKEVFSPSLACPRLTEARREMLSLQQRIRSEWNVSSFPLFLSTMHVPRSSWDLQKSKFVKLLLDPSEERKFVAGFSGSSVTAAHDSYFYEGFPDVFRRNLAPVFASLHINFTVRNHALGNNPCYPYDACIATHLGEDLDLLAWEQSMNCGRDSRPLDTFSRHTLSTPSKPSIMYLLSGTPAWSAADCAKMNITSTNAPRVSAMSETEAELLRYSLKHIVTTQKHMESMDFLKDNEERLFNRFSAVAPMGQSLFALEQYKCQGPYDLNFAKKTPGGGAPWHPGMRGHQVRGDALSLTMLAIMQEAVENVETLLCKGNQTSRGRALRAVAKDTPDDVGTKRRDLMDSLSTSALLQKIEKVLDLERTPAQQTKKTLTSFLNTHKPSSVHTLLALYLESTLQEIFSGSLSPVPAHYNVPETNHAPQCYTNYLPRQGNALDELLPRSEKDKVVEIPLGSKANGNSTACWTKELSFFDVNGVLKSEAKQLGYLDRKILFVSHCEGAALSFYISVKHESPVWLCECQKGFLKYPVTMADLIDGADVFIQENVNNKADLAHFDKAKARQLDLSLLKDQCFRTSTVPAGNHLLTIVQKGTRQINLSYIITW